MYIKKYLITLIVFGSSLQNLATMDTPTPTTTAACSPAGSDSDQVSSSEYFTILRSNSTSIRVPFCPSPKPAEQTIPDIVRHARLINSTSKMLKKLFIIQTTQKLAGITHEAYRGISLKYPLELIPASTGDTTHQTKALKEYTTLAQTFCSEITCYTNPLFSGDTITVLNVIELYIAALEESLLSPFSSSKGGTVSFKFPTIDTLLKKILGKYPSMYDCFENIQNELLTNVYMQILVDQPLLSKTDQLLCLKKKYAIDSKKTFDPFENLMREFDLPKASKK